MYFGDELWMNSVAVLYAHRGDAERGSFYS